MKKEYLKPSIEFIDFNVQDIVMNNIFDTSVEEGDDLFGDD